jgi:CheY-like chemotaxis protein
MPYRASTPAFILVVDDEPAVAEMATETLLHAGYHASFALDAYSGMRALEQQPDIDLLFTDIVMPGIDGFRLADMATSRRPGLKVLYATAYVGLSRELLAAGEIHGRILDKPYRPAQLISAVREALGQEAA